MFVEVALLCIGCASWLFNAQGHEHTFSAVVKVDTIVCCRETRAR